MLHHDNVTLSEVVLVCVLLKNGFNLLSVLRLAVPEKHDDSASLNRTPPPPHKSFKAGWPRDIKYLHLPEGTQTCLLLVGHLASLMWSLNSYNMVATPPASLSQFHLPATPICKEENVVFFFLLLLLFWLNSSHATSTIEVIVVQNKGRTATGFYSRQCLVHRIECLC